MSRIYYNGKFFDYPLKAAMNAWRPRHPSRRCCACSRTSGPGYVRPPKDQTTFEGWTAAASAGASTASSSRPTPRRCGACPPTTIQADWAAQRIKNLSLFNAVVNAILPKRNQKDITSLIEEFQYPKYGPGMMWERCRDKVEAQGTKVLMGASVNRIHHEGGERRRGHGRDRRLDDAPLPAHVISSMPISALLRAMDPPPPAEVLAAADGLTYRDFLTVALVVPEEDGFPDNWIYVHAPDVRLGRIQNFGSWSPYLVKEGRTCLGLEYFVFEGDDLWTMADDDLVELGRRELGILGLVDPDKVEAGYVVRMPKAYPMYDDTLQGERGRHAGLDGTSTPRTCTRSAATGCTSTTTRTTRCTRRCSRWRTSSAPTTTSGRSTSRRSTTKKAFVPPPRPAV